MTTVDTAAGVATAEAVAVPPVARRQPAAMSRATRRLLGVLVAIGCAAVLSLAAWMTPSRAGLGTHHEQLNMPPCGWIVMMELPCPTCGMTTAFAHAADGNLLQSTLAQPLGCVLALCTAMALLIGCYTAVTGSRVGIELAGLWTRRTTWWLIGIVIAAWIFKIVTYRWLL